MHSSTYSVPFGFSADLYDEARRAEFDGMGWDGLPRVSFDFLHTLYVCRTWIYVEENYLLGGVYPKISTDDRGLYFFTEGRRPEVKKYNPRSEVDHLRIYTDKEVVLLHNFDFPPSSTHPPQ